MPNLDVPQVVEAAAKAAYEASQRFNRGSVRAEDWELIPEYWRRNLRAQSAAALAVIVPAVTEQVRALHKTVPHEGAPGWFWCHGCRHSVSADAKVCPTVRALDELESAIKAGE